MTRTRGAQGGGGGAPAPRGASRRGAGAAAGAAPAGPAARYIKRYLFGRMMPGLYEVIQYTHTLSHYTSMLRNDRMSA